MFFLLIHIINASFKKGQKMGHEGRNSAFGYICMHLYSDINVHAPITEGVILPKPFLTNREFSLNGACTRMRGKGVYWNTKLFLLFIDNKIRKIDFIIHVNIFFHIILTCTFSRRSRRHIVN